MSCVRVCVCAASYLDQASEISSTDDWHVQSSMTDTSHYRPRSRGDNTFGSVRVRVCPFAVGTLLFEPFHLWPWFLVWGSTLTSDILGLLVNVEGQGQTVKIVYAFPFEPVVRSRLILGLGLPISPDGNCEWPSPVHWNCLFVSNQGRSTCRA